MKAAWDHVKLRVSHGDVPEPGTVLCMPSGRRYQVLKVGGRTLHCLVLPEGHKVRGMPHLAWFWTKRARKARR